LLRRMASPPLGVVAGRLRSADESCKDGRVRDRRSSDKTLRKHGRSSRARAAVASVDQLQQVRLGIGLGLGRRARKLVVQPLAAGRRRHRAGAGPARLRAGPGEEYGAKQAKSNTQTLIQDPAAEATWRAGKPRHQRHAGAFRLLDEAIAQTESRQALRHAGNSAESWPSAQASRK
jgi:hypothetical protein